ncbi:MAG: hypothetical protein L0Z50_17085, partial [Verrucomicrobiales bacterium]|nr:hypothetical protein [Verrucomicrobiales bacterium]
MDNSTAFNRQALEMQVAHTGWRAHTHGMSGVRFAWNTIRASARFVVLVLLGFASADSLSIANDAAAYRHQRWTTQEGLPDNTVLSLLQTHDGYLWIGTASGLARFDGVTFTIFNHASDSVFLNDRVMALAEGPAGDLWIGTHGGLLHLQNGSWVRFRASDGLWHDEIQVVCVRRAGEVWVGTLAGLNRISQNRIDKVPHLRSGFGSSSIINAICEDASGSMWIGTTAGLFRWNPLSEEFEDHHRAYAWTNSPAISRIVASGDGTLSALGENLNQRQGQTWHELKGFRSPLPEGWPHALLVDRTGAAWMGGDGGLRRFQNGVTVPFIKADESSKLRVNCLIEDREGNLWIGTQANGLLRWQPRRFVTYASGDGLADNNVRTLCESSEGVVWIGTDGGVSQWRNGNFMPDPIPEVVSNNRIRSLHVDRNGALWIGTGDSLECWQHEKLTSHKWSAAP